MALDFNVSERWQPYISRYERGEWRATIFRDLILAELPSMPRPVMLDIGSGGGFDDTPSIQASLADAAREYVAVEPDKDMLVGKHVTAVHRCLFEEAPIPRGSVDLAFSVMVLEHLEDPRCFFEKLREVLRPGGVFWGFTMDARHWFVAASQLADRLRLKDWYLGLLHGKRGEERYANYKVYYRVNTPQMIDSLTGQFARRDFLNFSSANCLDFYAPARLRWVLRTFNRANHLLGNPGSVLAVRLQR